MATFVAARELSHLRGSWLLAPVSTCALLPPSRGGDEHEYKWCSFPPPHDFALGCSHVTLLPGNVNQPVIGLGIGVLPFYVNDAILLTMFENPFFPAGNS